MARRPKPRSVTSYSSTIKELYHLIILPALRLKPKQIEWRDWLEELWGVKSRFISRYRVKEGCKIKAREARDEEALLSITLRKGVTIFVRVDADNPHEVHFEITSGKRNKGAWFITTKKEWRKVIPNLIHRPFRNRKRGHISWDVAEFY